MAEGVPRGVVEAAHRAFDCLDVEAELAETVLDWLIRSAPGHEARFLRFLGTALSVDVAVRAAGDDLQLQVRIHPPAEVMVEVRHRGAPLRERAGQDGSCLLEPVGHGFVSLRVTDERGALNTAWALL